MTEESRNPRSAFSVLPSEQARRTPTPSRFSRRTQRNDPHSRRRRGHAVVPGADMCSGHVAGSRCRLGPVGGDHVGMTAPDMVASGLPPSIRVAPSLDMFGQAVAQPVYHWPQQLLHRERVERRPSLRPRPAGDRLGVRQRNLPVPAGERKDPGLVSRRAALRAAPATAVARCRAALGAGGGVRTPFSACRFR